MTLFSILMLNTGSTVCNLSALVKETTPKSHIPNLGGGNSNFKLVNEPAPSSIEEQKSTREISYEDVSGDFNADGDLTLCGGTFDADKWTKPFCQHCSSDQRN